MHDWYRNCRWISFRSLNNITIRWSIIACWVSEINWIVCNCSIIFVNINYFNSFNPAIIWSWLWKIKSPNILNWPTHNFSLHYNWWYWCWNISFSRSTWSWLSLNSGNYCVTLSTSNYKNLLFTWHIISFSLNLCQKIELIFLSITYFQRRNSYMILLIKSCKWFFNIIIKILIM